MNRRHETDAYLTIVDKLRSARPDIAMSGDFIVGFPARVIRTLPTPALVDRLDMHLRIFI